MRGLCAPLALVMVVPTGLAVVFLGTQEYAQGGSAWGEGSPVGPRVGVLVVVMMLAA